MLRNGESVTGGGSTPGRGLPTTLIAVRHRHISAAELEEMLRRGEPPIVGRVEQDEFIIDLRTVAEDEEDTIAQAFEQLIRNK